MDIQQLTGKAYQLLANTIDPLEGRTHFYNITTTGLLALTSANSGDNKLTVQQAKGILHYHIDLSLTQHKRLILTSDSTIITIQDPNSFTGWKHFRWEILDKQNRIFLGTRAGV